MQRPARTAKTSALKKIKQQLQPFHRRRLISSSPESPRPTSPTSPRTSVTGSELFVTPPSGTRTPESTTSNKTAVEQTLTTSAFKFLRKVTNPTTQKMAVQPIELNQIQRDILKLAPEYTGEGPISEWWQLLRPICEAMHPAVEDFLQIIPMKFRGKALKAYLALDDHQKTTWEDLIESMAQALVAAKSIPLMREELRAMKKKPEEAISDFSKRVLDATRIAYTNADGFSDDSRQQIAADIILKQLPASAIKQIRRNPEIIRNMNDLTKAIETELAIDKEIARRTTESSTNDLIATVTQRLQRVQFQDKPQQRFNAFQYWKKRKEKRQFQRNTSRPRNNRYNPNFQGRQQQYQQEYKKVRFFDNQRPYQQQNQTNTEWTTNRRNEYRPFRRTSPALYVATTIMMLIGLMTQGQAYQLCGVNQPTTLVTAPTLQSCKVPTAERLYTTNITLYVLRRSTIKTSAIRCTKELIMSCATFVSFIMTDEPVTTITASTMSTDECLTLNKTISPEINRHAEPRKVKISRIFAGNTCEIITARTLYRGDIAISPTGKMTSNMGDLHGCHTPDIGKCSQEDDTWIWKPRTTEQKCPYVYAGIFKAIIAEKDNTITAVVETLQATFISSNTQLTQAEEGCVPPDSIRMENNAIVHILNRPKRGINHQELEQLKNIYNHTQRNITTTTAKPTTASTTRKLTTSTMESATTARKTTQNNKLSRELRDEARSTNQTQTTTETTGLLKKIIEHTAAVDELNVKLQYVETDIEHQFLALYNQICLMHNSQISLIQALLQIDPTTAVRAWLRRNDLQASFQGEAIAIKPCTPITPTKIYWSRKRENICYQYIPLETSDKKVYFIVDGSSDLSLNSPQTSCADVKTSVFKMGDGTWNTTSGEAHVLTIDHPIVHEDNHPIIFKEGSPYEQEDFSEVSLNLLKHYTQKINQQEIELKVEPEADIHKINNFIEDTWEKASATVVSWKDKFAEFGTYVQIIIVTVCATIILIIVVAIMYGIQTWKVNAATSLITTTAQANAIYRPVVQPSAPPANSWIKFQPSVYCCISKAMPFITTKINGNPAQTLIDTGASISLMDTSTREKLKLPIWPEVQLCEAANGSPIVIIGKTKFKLQLGKGVETPVTVSVTENGHCPATLLLGMDVLRQMQTVLDLTTDTIQMGGETSKICMIKPERIEQNQERWIKIDKTEDLLPGDNFLWGVTYSRIPNSSEWLVEPWDLASQRCARAVIKIQHNNKVPLRILNHTNAKIKVYKNERIATLQPIENERIPVFQPQKEHITNRDHYEAVQYINNICRSFERKQKPMISNINSQPIDDEIEYIPNEADVSQLMPHYPVRKNNVQFLEEQIDLSNSKLSQTGKIKFKQMLLQHEKAFVGSDGQLGRYRGPITHEIPLEDEKMIISQRPYRTPFKLREEEARQIREMLRQQVIRPSTSPFTAPVLMVRKRDNQWRFAIDYRQLNKHTKKQSTFLPLITDILDEIGGKVLYTTLDLQSAYHQVMIKKEDQYKTAFNSSLGLYEFCRMPFGLQGAPATFQRIMTAIKRQVQAAMLVYLDDVIIGSNGENEHLQDVDEVLSAIEKSGLKLKLSKCHWARESIEYLGVVINRKGISPAGSLINKIVNYLKPKTVTELKSFLGAASYLRRFIHNFSQITSPLTDLTRKNSDVVKQWTKEHDDAFELVKKKLTTAPVLASPRLSRPFVISTDASKIAIGGCLLQEHEGQLHPVAYWSRKLNPHEKKFSSIELETLAVVAACKEFRPYIVNNGKTIVLTDNVGAASLLKRKDLEGRLAKFQLCISPFNLEIKHRPGKNNNLCDFLSRYAVNAVLRSGKDTVKGIPASVTAEEVEQEQHLEYPEYFEAILEKRYPPNSNLREIINKFVIKNEMLHKFSEEDGDEQPLLVIPFRLRERIIQDFHANPRQGAHLGYDRTIEKLASRVYWPRIHTDVKNKIAECTICQRNKINRNERTQQPIQTLPVPDAPFKRINVDIAGPILRGEEEAYYILVSIDSLSKFVIATPIKNMTAKAVTDAFIKEVICIFGAPELIVSDQGSQFRGQHFADICATYGCTHQMTTTYHPEANGLVERANRTIGQLLRTCVQETGEKWYELLPLTVFALNTSIHQATQKSPFELVFGRKARLPSDNLLHLASNHQTSPRMEELHAVWKTVQHQLQAQNKRIEEVTNRRRKTRFTSYSPGEKILRINTRLKGKLDQKWNGPYTVLADDNTDIWIAPAEKEDALPPERIHKNKIKKVNQHYTIPYRKLF